MRNKIRRALWFARWLLCWAFGHTGNNPESGYHVCDRCGAHGYWSWKTSDPDCRFEYGNAGHFVNWYWRWQIRRAEGKHDDLPF